MKRKYLTLIIIIIVVLSGCFGAKKNETQVSKIVLEASKSDIKANGIDIVEFNVKIYDQKNGEITNEKLKSALHDVTLEYYEGKNKLEKPEFSTKTAGTYMITAQIGKVISNVVTVAAISTDHVNNYAISVNYGAQYTSVQAVKVYVIFTGNPQQEVYAAKDKIALSNDNTSWSNWIDRSDMINWTIPLGDGQKTVYAKFKDSDEIVSTSLISDSITLDMTAPAGTVTINNDAAVTTITAVTASWSVIDITSGPRYVSIQNEGGEWGSWSPVTPNNSTWTITSEAGIKRVNAKFMDNAGNTSDVVSDTIELVTALPEGSIAINENAQYTSSQSVTLRMNISGAAMMVFSNTENVWTDNEENYNELKNNWSLSDNTSGVKTVYGKFLSQYGNEYITSDTIILDTDLPTGTILINNGAAVTSSTALNLTLNSSDITSGIADMQFSEDGISWSGWEAAADAKTITVSGSSSNITVFVRWRDLAGNISIASSDTIVLDNVPPNGDISIIPQREYTSKSAVSLSININDNVSTAGAIKMALKNENQDEYPGYSLLVNNIAAWNLSSGDGLKVITGRFMDEAGNIYITAASITVDTVPPVFNISIDNGREYTSKTAVTANFSDAFDNVSGLSTMEIYGEISPDVSSSYADSAQLTLIDIEGIKTVKAKIYDGAGNSSIERSDTIIYDKTPPTGDFLINAGASVTTTTAVVLNMAVTDNFTSIGGLTMRFSADNTNFSSAEQYSATKLWSIVDNENTPQYVYAKFTDLAGNTYSTQASILLDHTGPNGTVLINNGDTIAVTTSVSLTLTINAGDAATGKASFSNDGTTWSSWENYATPKMWKLTAGDGEKTVLVRYMDQYGNIGGVSTDTIILDTRPLKINNSAEITSSRSVNLTINYPGASNIAFSNDTNNPFDWGGWESYATSKSWTLSSGDGPKKVYMRVKNSSGSLLADDIYDDIILDTTPPVGSININDGGLFTNNKSLSITVTAQDVTTSVTHIKFSESSGSFTEEWRTFTNGSAYNFVLSGETQGTRVVYAKIKDAAGNETTTAISDTIVYDTTAPTGLIKIDDVATSRSAININLSANDNITPPVLYMCFSLDGINYSAWETYNTIKNNYSIGTDNGNKKIYVKFKDGAGNESSSYSTVVTLDTQQPKGSIIINNGIEYTNTITGIAVTVNIQDDTTPVIEMRFKNEAGGSWSDWQGFDVTKTITLTNTEGLRTLYAEFMDRAGNTYITSDTIYYDITPPSATVKINNNDAATNSTSVILTFENIAENSGTGIEYIQVSNNDSSWASTPRNNYASSVSWSILGVQGTNTIYTRYTDKAGNTSVTTSDAIIYDSISPTGSLVLHTGTTSNASITVNRNVYAEVTGNSDTSGIKYVMFSNDGLLWSTPYDFGSGVNASKTVQYNWVISSSPGLNNVYMKMIDYAGNESSVSSRSITLQ